MKGPHNIANVMAALLAVSHCNIEHNVIKRALKTFKPLPHRLEFVEEIKGVKIYNDSKATNTDAVKYALQSFGKPIRIIMGGAGKGEDYSVLNNLLSKYAIKVYLVGDSAEEMQNIFSKVVETKIYEDYKACLYKAIKESSKEDIIVLSPACTSYDRFQNFEQRGNYFKLKVKEIKNEI